MHQDMQLQDGSLLIDSGMGTSSMSHRTNVRLCEIASAARVVATSSRSKAQPKKPYS